MSQSSRISSWIPGSNRGTRLTSLLVILTAFSTGLCKPALPEDRPPSIVLILADDLGYHQIGSYGNPYYQTPNVDRLAARGMRFTDAYSQTVCSPTRAALMTGKYPARLHLTDYIAGNDPRDRKLLTPPWRKHLPLDETTIAEVLKAAGYVTGHFGKWHLNKDKDYQPGRPGDPGSQGFDEVLTTVKPEEDADPTQDAHHVREITTRAIEFIRRHRNEPFFCYISHNSIHRPRMEAPELVARYQARPGADQDRNAPMAAAMVEVLDASIGQVLSTLDEMNLSDETLVVFYSDNGALGDPEVLKPFRGSKANLYEGGIRVPLVVRWPGRISPGTEPNVVCADIDLFPTLADAAGADIPDGIDGISLLPVLTGRGSLQRDAIYWHYPHYHHRGIAPAGAIRAGDFKLIEWFEKSIESPEIEGALELYNLKEDPSEQHNLAREMPDLATRLYQSLRRWREEVGAQEMKRNVP